MLKRLVQFVGALWCFSLTAACGESPSLTVDKAAPQAPASEVAHAPAGPAVSEPRSTQPVIAKPGNTPPQGVHPEPGLPRGTAWLLRERDLHVQPFRQGALLAELPFNTEVTLLKEPDLTDLERAAMVDVVAVEVPSTGMRGWVVVDMEEARAWRDTQVTPDELAQEIEVVREGLRSGSGEVGRLGADIAGLWTGEAPPAEMANVHEVLQQRRHQLIPDDLDAVCGLVSALTASNKMAEAATLRAQALASVGDPIARWMSADQAAQVEAARRALDGALTDQELAAAYLAVTKVLSVMESAAQSDFDPITGQWCLGATPWVSSALPGVEAMVGMDPEAMGIDYSFSLWVSPGVWSARAADTEGALDDDLFAFRRNFTDRLLVDGMDFGDSCTTLGDPERAFLKVLKRFDSFTEAGGAIAELAAPSRMEVIEMLRQADRCAATRSASEPTDPAGELKQILSDVALLSAERDILSALLERLQAP